MKILVKSYIYKPPFSGTGGACERDIQQNGCTVAQLLNEMGISGDEVGLIFVNHERVGKNHPLREGDMVELVPLLEGG
jgi:sulfur carrier protein ThiS